jgi:hypothetical protein
MALLQQAYAMLPIVIPNIRPWVKLVTLLALSSAFTFTAESRSIAFVFYPVDMFMQIRVVPLTLAFMTTVVITPSCTTLLIGPVHAIAGALIIKTIALRY